MLIEDAVQDYLLRSSILSSKTHGWYEQKLRFWLRWCKEQHVLYLTELLANDLYAFQKWMQALPVCELDRNRPYATSPVSPYTVRGYVQVIRQFSRWTVSETYLPSDPFARVGRPKEPQKIIQPFDAEQLQALLRVTSTSSIQSMRDRAMLLVLLDTGIRISEFTGLTLDRVHLQDEHPWLEIAWQTSKGKKAREVGLGGLAAQALRKYLRLARRPSDAKSQVLWLNRSGQPLTVSGVEQAIKELAKHAGIEGVRASPHTLRHTFSAQFLKNGGDVYALSRLLGHSSVAVTERYVASLQARDVRQRQQTMPSVAESFLRKNSQS